MSDRNDRSIQNASVVDDSTVRDVAPTIRTQGDTDGCGCLNCRNIETITTHRTVLDTLVWSVRLFRSYPSILGFSAVIILANRLLETESINILPVPAIDIIEFVTAFAFVFLIRAYVATIVAGELTSDRVTARKGLSHTVARIPAFGITILLVILLVMSTAAASAPLFGLLLVFPGNPIEIVGFPAVAGVGALVALGPPLLLLFKFWFALEACVVGHYGPVDSLRISWRITTNYRAKILLLVLIALGSGVTFYLPSYVLQIGSDLGLLSSLVNMIAASIGELLSVVWASAYAHIYVQQVITE
ncbi:hypothetical protein [Halorubrum sp. Ea8]|uniref:hypothetical protein n=1 Tax=Halorubrum sp. Ea8 TaxID=1383841 RepID=UPI000B982998|nr:hypothetical protein [Halorubrum sp. Ea8]OYR45984.1 hypothetical protein DJ81_04070 [Halorubrum sp. Hd13]OYR49005.1 hypothetical protein DJ74_09450 [Halorubrum sp. Ea8]